MATKTLEKLEQEYGVIFHGKVDLKEKLTEEEFLERLDPDNEVKHPRTRLDYKQRSEWLKYNGYKVTRENMIDTTLPVVNMPKGFEPGENQ